MTDNVLFYPLSAFFLCHRVVTLVRQRYFLKYSPAYLTNRDTVRHGLLVGQNVRRYLDTEGWHAGIVNNKFSYIFHAKRSISGSLLNFYLPMLGPIVSVICYLYFLIMISVISVPFSVLLTFLSTNIPAVDRLWFVCQPDKDV